MSGGRYFLDSSVLIYTFDNREPMKQERARALTEQALAERAGVISFQVVQECLSATGRKFSRTLTTSDLRRYLDGVLEPLCEVFSSIGLYREALDLRQRWQYSFYDSLIIAAALAAGCELLYVEDLQHGQTIHSLTLINPFRSL